MRSFFKFTRIQFNPVPLQFSGHSSNAYDSWESAWTIAWMYSTMSEKRMKQMLSSSNWIQYFIYKNKRNILYLIRLVWAPAHYHTIDLFPKKYFFNNNNKNDDWWMLHWLLVFSLQFDVIIVVDRCQRAIMITHRNVKFCYRPGQCLRIWLADGIVLFAVITYLT